MVTSDSGIPIAVLIPTHGRPTLLERTLDSVLGCRPPDRDVQLIVIENGGRHGAEEIVRRKASWVRPRYHYHEQANKSAALNSVIEELPESLLVFLDDDVRVDPALLLSYAEAAGSAREGRFFGGGLLVDYEEPPPDWLLGYLPRSATGWHPRTYRPLGDLYFFGANWAAFSRDIKRLNGFDPQFGPGGLTGGTGQETAMQQKLIRDGVTARYVHDAVVWHYIPKSRATPAWALRRVFRMGVTAGYDSYGVAAPRTLRGVPFWLIRSTLGLALQWGVSLFSGDPAARFRTRFKLMDNLGRIQGARRRYREANR